MTRLTSPSGEHQKDPTAQGAQEGQEDQTTPTEDRPGHPLFSPLILFPSDPLETSNRLGYPLCSSTATEPELTPLSGSFEFT